MDSLTPLPVYGMRSSPCHSVMLIILQILYSATLTLASPFQTDLYPVLASFIEPIPWSFFIFCCTIDSFIWRLCGCQLAKKCDIIWRL